MKIVSKEPSVNPGMTLYTIQVELPSDVEPGYLVNHTRNLTYFKPSPLNRPEHKSKKLTESLLTKGYDPTYPMVVTRDMVLTDGFNREMRMERETLRLMEQGADVSLENSPFDVYFMVDSREGIDLQERIVRRNADNTPWDGPSYLHTYCESKKEPYLQIKRIWDSFLDEKGKYGHAFGLGAVTKLATRGKFDSGSQIFKDGKLPQVDEDFAMWVLNFIKEHNVKSFGKRPTVEAFCDWFSYVWPTLTIKQRNVFKANVRNYNGREESTKQFDNFREWLNENEDTKLRKNTRAIKALKRQRDTFLAENGYFEKYDLTKF